MFDGVGLVGFKSRANAFMLTRSALSLVFLTILSSSSFHGLVMRGWGLWTDRVFSLSPGLAQRTPNNNNNNIEDDKIYTNNFSAVIMFGCRTSTLKLNWRNQFQGDQWRCVDIKGRKH